MQGWVMKKKMVEAPSLLGVNVVTKIFENLPSGSYQIVLEHSFQGLPYTVAYIRLGNDMI